MTPTQEAVAKYLDGRDMTRATKEEYIRLSDTPKGAAIVLDAIGAFPTIKELLTKQK